GDELGWILLLDVDDRLCVGTRAKLVSVVHVLIEFLVVVNLAIERDPHRPVFVAERLLPGSKVDNAEPPVPQSCHGSQMNSGLIRPSMLLHFSHPSDDRCVDRPARKINVPANSTHISGNDLHRLPGRPGAWALQAMPLKKKGESKQLHVGLPGLAPFQLEGICVNSVEARLRCHSVAVARPAEQIHSVYTVITQTPIGIGKSRDTFAQLRLELGLGFKDFVPQLYSVNS